MSSDIEVVDDFNIKRKQRLLGGGMTLETTLREAFDILHDRAWSLSYGTDEFINLGDVIVQLGHVIDRVEEPKP